MAEGMHTITVTISAAELEALVEDRTLWSSRDHFRATQQRDYHPPYRSLVRSLVRRHAIEFWGRKQ